MIEWHCPLPTLIHSLQGGQAASRLGRQTLAKGGQRLSIHTIPTNPKMTRTVGLSSQLRIPEKMSPCWNTVQHL
jgi:hypothetical protein